MATLSLLGKFLHPSRLSCRLLSGSPSARDELYDLVIVGGGMVGSALACSIGIEPSLSHKRVLLLEASRSLPQQPVPGGSYSNRVSAISKGSEELLAKVNAWKLIEDTRAHPFTDMHVWDACSDARIVFNLNSPGEFSSVLVEPLGDTPSDDIVASSYHDDASPSGDNHMGHIVENRVVLAALASAMEGCKNVEVERGVKVEEIRNTGAQDGDSWAQLVLEDGKTVHARLLVGADGSNSRVRQMSGFKQVAWHYDQSALVATVHISEAGKNSTAWQRFLPSGPIAMLPLSPTLSSITWTTSPSHASALMEMTEERFVDAVNVAFMDPLPQSDLVSVVNEAVRDALAVLTPDPPPPRQLPPGVCGVEEGSRAFFPLGLGHPQHYVKPRIALIGDAAHRMHPMAGLGVNLGFGDVAALSSILLHANSRGADWGSLSHLLEYETARQLHNVPTMAAIEGLQTLFSTSWSPVVLLRSVGLQLTNACTPVKDYIITHAQRAA